MNDSTSLDAQINDTSRSDSIHFEGDGIANEKPMPQSPYSAQSSETTSETQSVSDEQPQIMNANPRKVFSIHVHCASSESNKINLPFGHSL